MSDISAQPIPDMGALLSSYGANQANIGQTQANTAYIQGPQTQQAQGAAGLANAQTGLVQQQAAKAGYEVQMIKGAMEAMKNIGPTGKSEQTGDQAPSDPTEVGVAHSLNQKFGFVDPMGPPGLQQYINATAWINPAEAQRAEEWRKMLVARQTQSNQADANDIFQTASTLSQNGTEHPLTSLLSLKDGSYLKNVGTAIASDPDKSPEEKDAAAKTAIDAAAKYSHQYTGREITPAGDGFVDKATGMDVHAPKIGLSSEQQVEANKWLHTPQTMTIDNRTATLTPAQLGIKSPQDLLNNKSAKFSVPPPDDFKAPPTPKPPAGAAGAGSPGQPPGTPPAPGSNPNAPPGQPGSTQPGPVSPSQARNLPSSQGGVPMPGLNTQQSDFVKQQPAGFPQVPGNQQLNPDDQKQRDIYRKQAEDLSKTTNTEYTRAQDSLTQIKRINNLLDTPGLTLGPGSHEYSQVRTILENWTGTPAGQAGAYQVLSKVLNASEMNDLLQQFHTEGAQVRLGAYESRLIMEKLAANPNLTKGAIQQMLQWQGSDAQYTLDKSKVAGALLQSGKSVANFDKQYGDSFPKQGIVDSTVQDIGKRTGQNLKFEGAKGKTYSQDELNTSAQKLGMPAALLQEQLTKAGAIIK